MLKYEPQAFGYALAKETWAEWAHLENLLFRVISDLSVNTYLLLSLDFKMFLAPKEFGYQWTHTTLEHVKKSAESLKNAFVPTMGALSWAIIGYDPKATCYDPEPLWVSYLVQKDWNAGWVNPLKDSCVGDFSVGNPSVGAFLISSKMNSASPSC